MARTISAGVRACTFFFEVGVPRRASHQVQVLREQARERGVLRAPTDRDWSHPNALVDFLRFEASFRARAISSRKADCDPGRASRARSRRPRRSGPRPRVDGPGLGSTPETLCQARVGLP